MFKLSIPGWDTHVSPSHRHGRSHEHHPVLECLEDRSVPAVTATNPTAAIAPLGPAALSPTPGPVTTPLSPTGNVPSPLALSSPGTAIPVAGQTTPTPGPTAFGAQVPSPVLIVQTLSAGPISGIPAPGTLGVQVTNPTNAALLPSATVPTGFSGRLAFPGTGVQQRVATGSGPFDQPPGLFLVGGGGDAAPLPPVVRVAPRPAPMPRVDLPVPGLLSIDVDPDQPSGDALVPGGMTPVQPTLPLPDTL